MLQVSPGSSNVETLHVAVVNPEELQSTSPVPRRPIPAVGDPLTTVNLTLGVGERLTHGNHTLAQGAVLLRGECMLRMKGRYIRMNSFSRQDAGHGLWVWGRQPPAATTSPVGSNHQFTTSRCDASKCRPHSPAASARCDPTCTPEGQRKDARPGRRFHARPRSSLPAAGPTSHCAPALSSASKATASGTSGTAAQPLKWQRILEGALLLASRRLFSNALESRGRPQ